MIKALNPLVESDKVDSFSFPRGGENGSSLYRNIGTHILTDRHALPILSSIDITDIDVLRSHQSDLDYGQSSHLTELEKIKARNEHIWQLQENLKTKCLLLALDADQHSQIINCGIKVGNKGSVRSCRKRNVCERCSNSKRQECVKRFGGSFGKGMWHFITLSWDSDMKLDTLNLSDIDLHFDAMNSSMERLLKGGHCEGYLLVEEAVMSKDTFGNVLPHVHCLVHNLINAGGVGTLLSSWCIGYRDNNAEGIQLNPNIQVDPILDNGAFNNKLKYLFKPAGLGSWYQSEWERLVEPEQKAALFKEARNLVDAFFLLHKIRTKLKARGSMFKSKRQYVGK